MTSTSYSFNLIDKTWITFVRPDGNTVELSLRETLAQAHQLQMVAGDGPQQTVALVRLLLALLYRVNRPIDEASWVELWAASGFEMAALDKYFAELHHRFDLFDAERPFYQMDDLRVKQQSVVTLKHGFGFLHDTHFDHDDRESGLVMTPAQAARAAITVQGFGLGGLAGIPDAKHTDGPCASGVLFVIQGDDLKQTLLLNLMAYPNEAYFNRTSDEDLPAWEQDDPFISESQQPEGLLDYLTWQNRRILLYPILDDNGQLVVREWKVGPGLRLGAGVVDPFKLYYKSKEGGLIPQRFTEDKGLWRDSAALFKLESNIGEAVIQPMTFRWLTYLVESREGKTVLEAGKVYQCLALGMSKDRGKILFTRQESLPILKEYLANPELVKELKSALDVTGTVAEDLIRAARVMWMHLLLADPEQVGWKRAGINARAPRPIANVAAEQIDDWVAHTGVERAYWAGLDVPFQSFVVQLAVDVEGAKEEWVRRLRSAAERALEAASNYVGGDGRSLKATVRGQQSLGYWLGQHLPKAQTISTDTTITKEPEV